MSSKKQPAKKVAAKKKQPRLLSPIVVLPEDEDQFVTTDYISGDVVSGTFDQVVARMTKEMESENASFNTPLVSVYEIKVLRRATIRRNKVSVETETF